MIIKLFNINKKENSTKRPADAGTSFNCILKDDTSIISPEIKLDLGLPFNPSSYNYAYIEDFNRYYFINDWVASDPLWIASLSVDVLASFKEAIGDHDLYILRSSSESNNRIVDTKYPTLAQAESYIDSMGNIILSRVDGTGSKTIPAEDYFNRSLYFGYFYVGVIGANLTGVSYYCFNSAGFTDLIDALYNYQPTDMEDVSDGIAKHISNPIQYITTCYWLPFIPVGKSMTPPTTNINFGNYSIECECWEIDPTLDINKAVATFNIRKHPQASARGIYLNGSPFSNYTLQFNPFGSFPLDASLMVDDTNITCEWYVDYNTGEADLTIKSVNTLISNTRALLATPIRLNQASVDILGVGKNILSGAIGTVGSLLTGNIAGAVSSAVGGFIGATESKQPKIASIGGGGNFLPFNTYLPKLYSDFYYVADEFNAEIGRPLCKVRKPNVLGGYMVVLDGSINASATKPELQEINTYLTGGFYYE